MTKFRDALINRYQKLGRPDTTFIMACRLFPETALNDKILMKALEGYEAEAKEEVKEAPLMVCKVDKNGKTYWTERK
jgi:hypothetical protein